MEQRLVVRLGHAFDAECDITATCRGGKTHGCYSNLARRRNFFNSLQLLAAVFGLRVLLTNMISANEVFEFGDFQLLILVSLPFHFDTLCLLPPIGRKVAHVGVHRSVEQLQSVSGHRIQQEPVVADENHCL